MLKTRSVATYRIIFTQRTTMVTVFSPAVDKDGDVYFLKAVADNAKSSQHIGYATTNMPGHHPHAIAVTTVSGEPVCLAASRREAAQMIDAYHRRNNPEDYWIWASKKLIG
jgi:hypothetical protein